MIGFTTKTQKAYSRFQTTLGRGTNWRFLPKETKYRLYLLTYRARQAKKSQVNAIATWYHRGY